MSSIFVAVTLLTLLALKAPRAEANPNWGYVCQTVSLAPFGAAGDRCYGPGTGNLDYANVFTYERAGCVAVLDSANNFSTSWACGPAGSAPGIAATAIYGAAGYGTRHKGIIRNNNTSKSGLFYGTVACWVECT